MFRSCCSFLFIFSGNALELAQRSNEQAHLGPKGKSTSELLKSEKYMLHDFVRDFKRDYSPGTEEWTKREQIFQANLQKVKKLLLTPDLSWTPGVTKFMDYSDHEYSRLLGYKGRRSRSAHGGMATVSDTVAVTNLNNNYEPAIFNVAANSTINQIIRDQGACGSCWAVSATAALEGAMASNAKLMSQISKLATKLNTRVPTLSSQAMVSCTANPRHCGGTGGCDGATAELAYDMVKEKGLPLAVQWPYQSGMSGANSGCKASHFNGPKIGISGYTVLPKNKLSPLKQALISTQAPVVVSVDATNWNFYLAGIYSDTQYGKGDFTVNHAVALVGYMNPGSGAKGYWLIKNSWGTSFGESGYIRVEMKANEESHCGWDEDTHVGIACDGDPNRDWVCGTCGILYDSSLPNDPYLMN